MKAEKWKNNLRGGCVLGIILFLSVLLVASGVREEWVWTIIRHYFVLIFLGYLAVGFLLTIFHSRKRKASSHNFIGAGGFYWIMIFIFAFMILNNIAATVIPRSLYWIVWANIAVVIILWAAEYYYLKKMSQKLNNAKSLVRESSVITLPGKIESEDELYQFLTKYYGESGACVEVMEKEIPGIIKINGQEFSVSIQTAYSFFGTPDYYVILTTVVQE